jgi:predicted PurR-regulated permease PerM
MMMRSLANDERVNAALVQTGFNLLGLGAVFVFYLNYVMVSDYLTPVILAAVLALLLRGPRDAMHRCHARVACVLSVVL